MPLPPPPSREKLPVTNGWAEMPRSWVKWFSDLAAQTGAAAATAWSSISKTGSSLADLETRNHSALQNLNTADHAHLYLADRDSLVGGANTTLHYHDSDRARAGHTGTQTAATISDFDSAVTASTHAGLTNNPHAVTAAQVGAKPLSVGYTVATLPAGTLGAEDYVTDALAPAWNTALTGGGTVKVKVFHNGTIWVAA